MHLKSWFVENGTNSKYMYGNASGNTFSRDVKPLKIAVTHFLKLENISKIQILQLKSMQYLGTDCDMLNVLKFVFLQFLHSFAFFMFI